MRKDLADAFGQRIPLLDYLEQRGWKVLRGSRGPEVAGLCPLHREAKPSFYVNRRKNVFYCHGCGRGGDLIRLMQVWEGLSFRQAAMRLSPVENQAPPLEEAIRFYRRQLPRRPQALAYLERRGIHSAEVVERMRIGFALTRGGDAKLTLSGDKATCAAVPVATFACAATWNRWVIRARRSNKAAC